MLWSSAPIKSKYLVQYNVASKHLISNQLEITVYKKIIHIEWLSMEDTEYDMGALTETQY